MKKLVFLLVVLSLVLLPACIKSNNDIPSVDLSQVEVNGIQIGDSMDSVSVDNYTPSTRFPENEGTYNYEEVRIETDDHIITKITATISSISISVNGDNTCTTYDEVMSLLGKDGSISWYDREQNLRQAQYADDKSGVICSFVYNDSNNQLVWLVLEKRQ